MNQHRYCPWSREAHSRAEDTDTERVSPAGGKGPGVPWARGPGSGKRQWPVEKWYLHWESGGSGGWNGEEKGHGWEGACLP